LLQLLSLSFQPHVDALSTDDVATLAAALLPPDGVAAQTSASSRASDSHRSSSNSSGKSEAWDVFLGGSCGGDDDWRATLAVPQLRARGLHRVFNPLVTELPDSGFAWDVDVFPREMAVQEACAVLLFVIAGNARSVGSLIEAANAVGLGRPLVRVVGGRWSVVSGGGGGGGGGGDEVNPF
jgi:hypothetical protein